MTDGVRETDDEFRDWDAAYVLGVLDAEDRRAFERHLKTCNACSAAVAELAGMPGILGLLTPDDAVAVGEVAVDDHLRGVDHEPDLIRSLAGRVRRRRRRVRAAWLTTTLALVVALVVSGIGLATLRPPTTVAGGSAVTMSQVRPDTLSADVRVTAKAWGSRFDWSCSYQTAWSGTSGETSPSYDLVVTDAAGRETTVATWTATGERAAGLSASSSIPVADIRSIAIRLTGSTEVLVRGSL